MVMNLGTLTEEGEARNYVTLFEAPERPLSVRGRVGPGISIADMSRIRNPGLIEANKVLRQKFQEAQKQQADARQPLGDKNAVGSTEFSLQRAAAHFAIPTNTDTQGFLLQTRLLTQKALK
jgi:hypothetical protein